MQFTLPALSPDGTFDTSNLYGAESVNFGERYGDSHLPDL